MQLRPPIAYVQQRPVPFVEVQPSGFVWVGWSYLLRGDEFNVVKAAVSARTPYASRKQDVAPFRGMTPEEHDVLLQRVVRAAHQLLIDHPRAIEPEPPAPDFKAAWNRLRDERNT